jgi:hypothetical protein
LSRYVVFFEETTSFRNLTDICMQLPK